MYLYMSFRGEQQVSVFFYTLEMDTLYTIKVHPVFCLFKCEHHAYHIPLYFAIFTPVRHRKGKVTREYLSPFKRRSCNTSVRVKEQLVLCALSVSSKETA